jgi:hypothetical protein
MCLEMRSKVPWPDAVTCRVFAVGLLLSGASVGIGGEHARDSVVDNVKQFRWATDDVDSLNAVFKDSDVVAQFLNEIVSQVAPGSVHSVPDYKLMDLHHDGWLELIALVDDGRTNEIAIVAKKRGDGIQKGNVEFDGFVQDEVHGFEMAELAPIVHDLDGDGAYELIVPTLMGEYRGMARPNPIMDEIYQWNGHQFTLASSKFGWYYERQVIPELEREAQELASTSELSLSGDELEEFRFRKADNARELAEARRRAAGK